MSQTISAGLTPRIKVDIVGGDLSIVGWDGTDILVRGDDEDMRLDQSGEEVQLSCGGDLSLRVPKGSSIEFKKIGGDASMKGIIGGIKIKDIGGDLSIRDAGSITIDTIHADFSLRGAKGDLYVKNAQADVSVRDVDGSVIFDSVGDDLALRGVRGNIKVNVGADVIVYLDPKPDGAYAVDAGDDVLLVLPSNANATVTMQADEIEVDWPGQTINDEETERVVVLGNGSAKIALSAGGDIRVSNREDAGNHAEEFGNFAGLGFDWSGFGEQISRQVERATSRATKQAEEAGRRAERQAERHARKWKATGKAGRWDVSPSGVITPPTPPASEPVSEDERMAILKMLQEKKITSAQAEELLKALEGGG
jgi:hypothetical protein